MSAAAYREGVSDADILRQTDAIKREVEETQPLVGERQPPDALLPLYAENPQFLPKIADLNRRLAAIRRTRGDGSCFYRAFLVSLGEHFVAAEVSAPVLPPSAHETAASAAAAAAAVLPRDTPAQRKYDQVLAYVDASFDKLIALGYPDLTLSDFHDAMKSYLLGLGAPGATAETAVFAPFRDQMRGFYIITELRMLCSLELLTHEDDYFPFVLGVSNCATVKQFCDVEVEAVSTDADQLQVTAVARGWGCSISVAYLDSSAGDAVTMLQFPQDAGDGAATEDGAYPLLAHLLYRPGHYDIAYPKAAV